MCVLTTIEFEKSLGIRGQSKRHKDIIHQPKISTYKLMNSTTFQNFLKIRHVKQLKYPPFLFQPVFRNKCIFTLLSPSSELLKTIGYY